MVSHVMGAMRMGKNFVLCVTVIFINFNAVLTFLGLQFS